ncbi:MAG: ABC-F family ATP-binding cassette domain-containing protein [Streptococcaceae bacterium]|jgi:ATP-binding cassette subfamily F protein 3|nr:ABC-F family ATP-binding cassette domain-containing protein [Streptococcaceae bacterium]
MIILQGNHISRSFAGDVLFENVSFSIQERSRIALVGKNGAGKSTLLKIIVGEEEPTTGVLTETKGLTIGYLAQNTGLSSDFTILEELESVFETLHAQEKELHLMESEMSGLTGRALSDLMKRYDQLSEVFRASGGFTYESDLRAMLNAFNFPENMWQQQVSSLSGGQKTRLALAKMLLTAPDLLVLDEPTNHLDIETLSWLENYLLSYKGALLIVSHDRYFLDKVADEVLELSRGSLTRFAGNYSHYIEAREVMLATAEKEFEKQQKEIAALEDFVAKNLTRASTTKRAQSRRKRLEKMERLEAPKKSDKSVHLVFKAEKTSGNEVLKITDAAIGYDKVLSKNINLDQRKLEAIAIVGPNGIGKSTLIKSVLGQIPFLAGGAKIGANVTIGYYDQEQAGLTVSNTALEELWSEHRLLPEVEIRNVLGAFLFSGDDVKKTVGMLSGGEKARLLLAKLAMRHDNFLLLDEPTNHLDIDSREVLEQALIEFDGTLLFVSHDRYFINQVATQVMELSENASKLYAGDYDYYMEQKAKEVQPQNVNGRDSKVDSREAQKNREREMRKREREIAEIELTIDQLDVKYQQLQFQMMQSPEDFEKLAQLQKEVEKLSAKKEPLEARWLELLDNED